MNKKIMLLGSGELGKEFVIVAKRIGQYIIAVDSYDNAPAMQVAHRSYTLSMLDGDALRKIIEDEKPDLIVPEIEAIATDLVAHYIANLRDLEFNLFEVLRLDEVLGTGRYSELDRDTVQTMLDEVMRLAVGPVAQSFAEGDRNPPVFDPNTHTVTYSPELAKSVQAIKDAEWWRLGLPEEIGGIPGPAPLTTTVLLA